MSLEVKKKEVELKRILLAKDECELKIAEREEEINRLKEQIKKQEEAAEKIKQELEDLK